MAKTDYELVTESMYRYGRAVDSRDYSVLRSAFTEDAIVRYSTNFSDDLHGIAALKTYLEDNVTQLSATQHLFGNFEVDVADGKGTFRCCVQAQHVQLGAKGGHLFTVGGHYLNHVVRCDDGLWRMTLLTFEPTWSGGNTEVLGHAMPDDAAARAT